ncbi:hypothetical protein [Methanobacterium sp.]|uniref:hypothetical protein n=1 Tax=Methanobacterium sp. TaxID=2164 RepID=UPI003C72CA0C
MKISHMYVIFGCLILLGSLLISLSSPLLPIIPLIVSISIIFIIWGIFEIKKYENIPFSVTFSIIILLLGAILSIYEASLPINRENMVLNYTYIGVVTPLIFFVIYILTRRFKKHNAHLDQT